MGQPLPPPPEDHAEFYMGQQMRMNAATIAAAQQHQQQQGRDSAQFPFHKNSPLLHCTLWGVSSVVMFCSDFFRKFRLPIELHNSNVKNGFTKHHD